jgi:AraC-like DNA-binding protein
MGKLMVLVLDSDTLPVQDREEAYRESFLSSEVPHTLDFTLSEKPVRVRMDFWDLGPGMHILRSLDNGVGIFRTAKQLKMAAPETIAFGYKLGGAGMYENNAHEQDLHAGDIHLVDQTTTMRYVAPTNGGSQALMIEIARLGLPVDTVRKAIDSLRASPVYQLFRSHLGQLCTVVDNLPDGPGKIMFTQATLELSRALIATAAGDVKRQRDALHESEYSRVMLYISQHLTDPDLSVERIARENYISVRQLYRVWAVSELPLNQYIISQRLEGARAQLARFDGRAVSIGAVSSAWGFLSPAHFSRRFKSTFGVTPQVWRQVNIGDQTPDSSAQPEN